MKSLTLILSMLPLVSGFFSNSKRSTTSLPPVKSSSSSSAQERIRLFPFEEARKIARGHGFSSKEEFVAYSCPGAYQLPKDPDRVWSDEWKGWEDFLGICYPFEDGRAIARSLLVESKEEYMKLFEEKRIEDNDPASRLPYRPDLKYKDEWKGWDDWLKHSNT
jgi:hypothetical protein